MSRTYKDKPWKFTKYYDQGNDTVRVEYIAERTRVFCPKTYRYITLDEPVYCTGYYFIKVKTSKPKAKRSEDTKWFWHRGTPSAWTRTMMNRPQRYKGRRWERKVLFEDIEETDPPGVSRKPHVYYW